MAEKRSRRDRRSRSRSRSRRRERSRRHGSRSRSRSVKRRRTYRDRSSRRDRSSHRDRDRGRRESRHERSRPETARPETARPVTVRSEAPRPVPQPAVPAAKPVKTDKDGIIRFSVATDVSQVEQVVEQAVKQHREQLQEKQQQKHHHRHYHHDPTAAVVEDARREHEVAKNEARARKFDYERARLEQEAAAIDTKNLARRPRRGMLDFVEAGSVVRRAAAFRRRKQQEIEAEREREEAEKRELLQGDAAEAAKEAAAAARIADAAVMEATSSKTIRVPLLTSRPIYLRRKGQQKLESLDGVDVPFVEWWDRDLLPSDVASKSDFAMSTPALYTDEKAPVNKGVCTSLVHRPVPLQVSPYDARVVFSTYMTKKENKKARRQVRQVKRQQDVDMIRLGLKEAPEPRVRARNLHKVIAQQSTTADPTVVERKLRSQMEARHMSHLLHNAQHRLKPEERRAKKTAKLREDTSQSVNVVAFRVSDLSSRKKQFQVGRHAEQRNLTGVVVRNRRATIVVAEGGPKNIRKYIRLLMRRVNWLQDDSIEIDDAATVPTERLDADGEVIKLPDESCEHPRNAGNCVIVWQGTAPKRHFSTFSFENCTLSEERARQVLQNSGLAHLWDLALRTPLPATRRMLALQATQQDAGAAAAEFEQI